MIKRKFGRLMKRRKRLFGILLIITALIIMQLPVAEADAATSASDFKLEGTTLVKYRGTETNVSVPNTVEVIGEDAFAGNTHIELVVLPDSVKEIEAYAFWGCENLDCVVLGGGLTEIGDFVFANCKGLKQMTIPSTVRSIGMQAFVDCVNLTDVTIAPEVTNIHESAFDGCYRLLIHCEAGTVADQYAEEFYERQKEMPEYEDVSNYQTDEETDDINEQETSDSTVAEEIVVGDAIGSTQVVGNQAVVFIDNTSLQVQSGKEDMEALEAVEKDKNTYTGEGIPKYTIVDGTIVADQAYYRNKNLHGITLPDGIVEIGQFAFARSSVTEVKIPEGTKTIGYGAFYHCDTLTEIELPETIENVEPKAFNYTAWVENFMQNGTEDFLISGGVLVAYRGNAEQVTIPDGVRVIAGEAFMGHSEIKEVSLPDTLNVIGEAAFADCSNLKNIYFGDQILQIKDRAFSGCAISAVLIPASVQNMGIKVFDDAVQIRYGGIEVPETTHEHSAERLSNEVYRPCKEEESEPGVVICGIEGVTAHLEGAVRSYALTITETVGKDAMEKAFVRGLQNSIPADTIVYDLQLSDNSGIPIVKLGKQLLEITMPVPASLTSENLEVYTLDSNGQLEKVEAERVKVDGVDCLRFTVDYLSQIGVTGNGTTFDASYVVEETTNIVSMSAAPKQQVNTLLIQWAISGVLLLSGIVCIFWKRQ